MYAFAPRDELLESFVNPSCLESADMAATGRRELDIRRDVAVEIAQRGFYFDAGGEKVNIGELVARAVSAKQSLPPDVVLPTSQRRLLPETRIQVANETTLGRHAGSWKANIAHWR
jgi:hypothetical protein